MECLVLEHPYAEDHLERRPLREQHLALIAAAVARREVLPAGPLTDPYDRAARVWAGEARAAAEAVPDIGPYVDEGRVTSWQVRSWNVVAGSLLPA